MGIGPRELYNATAEQRAARTKYKRQVKKLFGGSRDGARRGSITPENELKTDYLWTSTTIQHDASGATTGASTTLNEENGQIVDEMVRFARRRNMKFRGHTLLFTNSNIPNWLKNRAACIPGSVINGVTCTDEIYLDNSEIQAAVRDYIKTVMQRYDGVGNDPGKIDTWDVVNEPIDEVGKLKRGFWYDHLGGNKWVENAFAWAHQANPKPTLMMNEIGIDYYDSSTNANLRRGKARGLLRGILRTVGDQQVGVGFEMHLSTAVPATAQQFKKGWASVVSVKYPKTSKKLIVEVTEMDVQFGKYIQLGDVQKFDPRFTGSVDFGDPSLAAKPYVDAQKNLYIQVAAACRDFRQCKRFTVWGASDLYSWKDLPDQTAAGTPLPDTIGNLSTSVPHSYATLLSLPQNAKPAYDSVIKRLKR